MKRLFDILSSGIGLIVLFPLFLITSIWIKSDSQGPVFYKQKRVGKNNIDFTLLKFRSMKIGSDQKRLITVGSRDSRITRSGYFLRKYKIDELPQLINVFIGDMSLVGPRPEVRKYVDMYTKEQMKVLSVRPGITDYASIAYINENEILEKSSNPDRTYIEVIVPAKIALNMRFFQHPTFFCYLKIIFLTIIKIFR